MVELKYIGKRENQFPRKVFYFMADEDGNRLTIEENELRDAILNEEVYVPDFRIGEDNEIVDLGKEEHQAKEVVDTYNLNRLTIVKKLMLGSKIVGYRMVDRDGKVVDYSSDDIPRLAQKGMISNLIYERTGGTELFQLRDRVDTIHMDRWEEQGIRMVQSLDEDKMEKREEFIRILVENIGETVYAGSEDSSTTNVRAFHYIMDTSAEDRYVYRPSDESDSSSVTIMPTVDMLWMRVEVIGSAEGNDDGEHDARISPENLEEVKTLIERMCEEHNQKGEVNHINSADGSMHVLVQRRINELLMENAGRLIPIENVNTKAIRIARELAKERGSWCEGIDFNCKGYDLSGCFIRTFSRYRLYVVPLPIKDGSYAAICIPYADAKWVFRVMTIKREMIFRIYLSYLAST